MFRVVARRVLVTRLLGCSTSAGARSHVRFMSVKPALSHDYVRLAIQKMMDAELKDHSEKDGSVNVKMLNQSVAYFQNQLENARLCILDCKDAALEDQADENKAAGKALESAVQSYVDYVELLSQCDQPPKAFMATRSAMFDQLKAQLQAHLANK